MEVSEMSYRKFCANVCRRPYWGEGEMASSDGQRFGVRGSSLLAAFYPRYFGYYDRAVSVYTHLSDQYSVFNTQVISCAEREALHIPSDLVVNRWACDGESDSHRDIL